MSRTTSLTWRLTITAAATLGLALASHHVASAAAMTLMASATSGSAGREVDVPIAVRKSSNLGALEFELRYDPEVLDVREAVAGPLLSGAMLSSNVTEPGRLVVALASGESIQGDGVLVNVRATVRQSSRESSPLTLEKVRAWENRIELPEMLVLSEPAVFHVVTSPISPMLIALAVLGAILAITAAVAVARSKGGKTAAT